jgi:hypothetical protein
VKLREEFIFMSDSSLPKEGNRDSALGVTWGKYNVFAATSRALKTETSVWRLRVLILSISGAILGSICQQSTGWGLAGGKYSWMPTFFGILSAIALALAAYFGKEILNPGREHIWLRARSVAESLKAEAYLFSTKAGPYDKSDAVDLLFKRTEALLKSADNIQTVIISDAEKIEGLIPEYISVEQYIQMRVIDQIEGFYIPSAFKIAKIVKSGRQITIALGALAVFLGVLGASGWTAAWVAVVTTIILAITVYLYAEPMNLVISYQATARRLELLRARWQASGMDDNSTDERNQFILNCEEAISIENSAWMAELPVELK